MLTTVVRNSIALLTTTSNFASGPRPVSRVHDVPMNCSMWGLNSSSYFFVYSTKTRKTPALTCSSGPASSSSFVRRAALSSSER
ncbi:hypothetical protein KC356_g349 [Hortaea werneckii]|nr:hypothetical protein KC356_g349 [Hortaea werneckii]